MARIIDTDVVVIGGGLAGLAAAHGLRGRRVQLLEAEERVGGRVLSVRNDYVTVDLGACFAVGTDVYPEPATATLPQPRIAERGPIGIVIDGKLVLGADPSACIAALPVAADVRNALRAFMDRRMDAASLPPAALRIVDAFFKQIHPGDVRAYIAERQADAIAPLYPDHYPEGNGCSVDAFVAANAGNVDVSTGTIATAVREDGDGVLVHARSLERPSPWQVRARAAIVATPADVTRRLVEPTNPACAAFLRTVDYATYTTVGLVFDAPELPRFRYLVSPDCPLNVVVQQSSVDGRYRSLLCYYSDPFAPSIATLADEELTARTLGHLRELHCDGLHRERVVFSAIRRWPRVGTLLTPAYVAAKSPDACRASDRIFLAGDYASADKAWGYGTVDAVSSGRAAAAAVVTRLATEA